MANFSAILDPLLQGWGKIPFHHPVPVGGGTYLGSNLEDHPGQAEVGAAEQGDFQPVRQRALQLAQRLDQLRQILWAAVPLAVTGEIGQPKHPVFGEGIEGTIDEHPQPFPPAEFKGGQPVVVALQGAAALIEVERQLDHSEAMAGGNPFRLAETPLDAGHGWIRRGQAVIVGADAVPADATLLGLLLQETEGLSDAAVELLVVLRGRGVVVGLVAEIVLRIVQQEHVHPIPLQPVAGGPELCLQEAGVNAVPDPLAVLHHLREGLLLGQGHVLPLDVPGLGDHHRPGIPVTGEDFAHQRFRPAVGVVGAGVDQVPSPPQVLPERGFVFPDTLGDAIAAESQRMAADTGIAQGSKVIRNRMAQRRKPRWSCVDQRWIARPKAAAPAS